MAVIGEAEVTLRSRWMGGPGQRRYWLLNKRDGLLGCARALLAPRSLCGAMHRLTPSGKFVLTCDKRRRHGGSHMDRRATGRMPKLAPKLWPR